MENSPLSSMIIPWKPHCHGTSRSSWCAESISKRMVFWALGVPRLQGNVAGALHRSHWISLLTYYSNQVYANISPIYSNFFYAYLHLHLSIYCISLYIYIQIHDISMIINPSKLSTPSPIWQVLPCTAEAPRWWHISSRPRILRRRENGNQFFLGQTWNNYTHP